MLNVQAAKQAGYTDAEINAYVASHPSTGSDNPVVSVIRGLGGGGLADMAGVSTEIGRKAAGALGMNPAPNPYFTEAQKAGFSANPAKEIGTSALRDILHALIVGGTVGLASGITPWLTKAGTAGLSTAAANEGKDIPWESIKSKATEGVSKFGNLAQDAELRNTLNALLERIKPSTVLSQESMSSAEALNTRRQLLERYGTNILDFLKGGPSLEQKVAGSLRGGLTSLIHEAAPGTNLPDKLYSLYSKGGAFGGDIPTLAVKYGLGIPILKKLLGPLGNAIGHSVQ